MNLRDYLSVLRRRKWIGIVVLAVAVGTSALLTTVATPLYQARARLFVGPQQVPSSNPSGTFLYSASIDIAQRLTKTYAQMAPSLPVAERAVQEQGLQVSPQYVAGNLTAVPVTDTQLIDLIFTDADPTRAANIVNGVGTAFVEISEDLSKPAGSDVPVVPVTLFERASVPGAPISPNASRNLALAVALGLAAAVMVMFAAEYLDVAVRGADDIERLVDLPVLAIIPQVTVDDLQPARGRSVVRAAQ